MRVERFLKTYLPIIVRHGGLSKHPLLRRVDRDIVYDVAKRVYFSEQYRFCYFRVPKAGSSTILQSLVAGLTGSRIPMQQIQREFHGIPEPGQLNSTFTFTFVRHPAKRVLSAYLDKSREEKFVQNYPFLGVKAGTAEGFDHFLGCLEDGQLMANLHWAPQTMMLPFSIEQFDSVGRFEQLEADLRHCLEQICGWEVELYSHRPHKTRSKDLANHYIGSRQKALIERLYRADFEQLYPDAA